MNQQLAPQNQGQPPQHTQTDRGLYQGGESRFTTRERDQLRALQNIGDASDADLEMLFTVAQRTGLDPFIREIYLVGRPTKTGGYRGDPERWETRWTVQAGIDGFRKVTRRWAEKQGLPVSIGLPKFLDPKDGEHRFWLPDWGEMAACEIEITAGNNVARHMVQWNEYAKRTRNGNLNAMWASMGATMISKCAEAGAHRKLCSLTAGMYTPEEMEQAFNQDPQVYRQQATREDQGEQHQARGVSALEQGMNAYMGNQQQQQRERVTVTPPQPQGQQPAQQSQPQQPAQNQGALGVLPPEVQTLIDEIGRIRTATSPKFNEISDKATATLDTNGFDLVHKELQKKYNELQAKAQANK